jgi:hypothetical protein
MERLKWSPTLPLLFWPQDEDIGPPRLRVQLPERITVSRRIYDILTLRRLNYMSILTTDWSKLILEKISNIRIIKIATRWQQLTEYQHKIVCRVQLDATLCR